MEAIETTGHQQPLSRLERPLWEPLTTLDLGHTFVS